MCSICAATQDADKAAVDNKLKVTEEQMRAFLDICWTKYVKAKIEPGAYFQHLSLSSIVLNAIQVQLLVQ